MQLNRDIFIKNPRNGVIIISLLFLFFLEATSIAGKDEKTFSDLERDLEYILELIVKRQLSDDEIAKATREYYSLFDNKCETACIENTEANRKRVEPMKIMQGEPADLLARQYYSRVLYFSPTQAGSFIQELTNEADPIRIADPKSNRIMTQSDVVGAMNISRFLQSGGTPTNYSFTEEEITAEITSYHKTFVDGWQKLPFRAGLSAEFWAGLYQNWDKLSKRQQQEVFEQFADPNNLGKISTNTYAILLNFPKEQANNWRETDIKEHGIDRLNTISGQMMMGKAAVIIQNQNSAAYSTWFSPR